MNLISVLELAQAHPFGVTIGRPRCLYWPIFIYRVTLPSTPKSDNGLNPFERVILRLIDAGGFNEPESLSQESCIPVDLVQCVLLRLQDKGFLDEHNTIKRRVLERQCTPNNEIQDFVTAYVFRELVTGIILPHLHILEGNQIAKDEVEEGRYNRRIRFNETCLNMKLNNIDVITALRGMQKRSTTRIPGKRLPSVKLITIADVTEHCHLACPIAIQRSDGEFRIADPFGNGFSMELERAFNALLEMDDGTARWLMDWKSSLSIMGPNQNTTANKEPYDRDSNWNRYPNLLHALRLRRESQHRSIEQIYASLEWALFYCCAQRSFDCAVQHLRLTKQSAHPNLFQSVSESLSLDLPQGGLFAVKEGKLEDFLEGKAELGTVLSLSLLMAADDESHPLRQVSNKYRDFIVRLLIIKRIRDESLHGAGRVRVNKTELPDETFMRDVVTTLLPEIQFSSIPSNDNCLDSISDARMDARTSIQGQFGFPLFNRFGTNLQDRLIIAEQFYLACNDGDNAKNFICDLYAGLQTVFRKALTGLLPPVVSEADFISIASKRAQTFSLGELKTCLLTVKRSAIRDTLLGSDQTLQSCVIAFLLMASDDALFAASQKQPSLISDIANIIDRRGHGNEPLPLLKKDVLKLRNAAYTSITTLLEV